MKAKDVVGHAKLQALVAELKKYIATPWVGGKPVDLTKYAADKKAKPKADCSSFATMDPLCQAHAGNLFEHSQWTTYQIQQWADTKILDGVDLNTALVSAFAHDLGKGGDCIYDMYSDTKYNKQGDRSHPTNCGDVLAGTAKFFACNGATKGAQIDVRKTISEAFPKVNINEVALAAYMHWELGTINAAKTDAEKDAAVKNYLRNFKNYVSIVNLKPSKKLLRLCLAVSCADIAGSNPVRVSKMDGAAPSVYHAKDPWTLFSMDKNHQVLIDKVLAAADFQ